MGIRSVPFECPQPATCPGYRGVRPRRPGHPAKYTEAQITLGLEAIWSGKSRREAAELAGVAFTTLRNIDQGGKSWRWLKLKLLAKRLHPSNRPTS